jgi:hypothetical protein
MCTAETDLQSKMKIPGKTEIEFFNLQHLIQGAEGVSISQALSSHTCVAN